MADHGITVTRLAVTEVPRSGKPGELLEKYGISASHIVAEVRRHVREPASVQAQGTM